MDFFLAGPTYTVYADSQKVFKEVLPHRATVLLVGSYFVLNIQYARGTAATLEFFQR